MASNFRIIMQCNSDDLHLKLTGDFDGKSASSLLHILKKEWSGVDNIFVDTDSLENIFPHGLGVFRRSVGEVHVPCKRLVFTGRNAAQLAPERAAVFR